MRELIIFQLKLSRRIRMAMGMIVIVLTVEFIPNQKFTILRFRRWILTGVIFFRSDLIAINEGLYSITPLTQDNEIWILSDNRSSIQYLANSQGWSIVLDWLFSKSLNDFPRSTRFICCGLLFMLTLNIMKLQTPWRMLMTLQYLLPLLHI